MSDEPKPWPNYSFLEQAAAEAREASRRFWAKGSIANRKWPQQPVDWPLDGSEPAIGPDQQVQPKTRRGRIA